MNPDMTLIELLNSYELSGLYVDANGSVDLRIAKAEIRRRLPEYLRVLWRDERIEAEAERLGILSTRPGRAPIRIICGYSLADPQIAAREAKKLAEKLAAEAAEAAESAKHLADERAANLAAAQAADETENNRIEAEAADEAAFDAQWVKDVDSRPFSIKDFVEHAPGESIALADIEDKIGQLRATTCRPETQPEPRPERPESEASIRLWPGREYLGDSVLKDHRWCLVMLYDDGSLRARWDFARNRWSEIPGDNKLPYCRSGGVQYALDDPRAQSDSVTRDMADRRKRWVERPKTPLGRKSRLSYWPGQARGYAPGMVSR
jgi:hypothetical protein